MLPMWTFNTFSFLCAALGVLLLALVVLWGLGIVVVHILRQLGAWPAFVKFVRVYHGRVRYVLEAYDDVERRLQDAREHIDTMYRGYVHILPKLHAIDVSNSTSVEVIAGDQDHGPLIDLIMRKILPAPAYSDTPYLRLRAAARASKIPQTLIVRISQEYYQKYGASIPAVVSAWVEIQQWLAGPTAHSALYVREGRPRNNSGALDVVFSDRGGRRKEFLTTQAACGTT